MKSATLPSTFQQIRDELHRLANYPADYHQPSPIVTLQLHDGEIMKGRIVAIGSDSERGPAIKLSLTEQSEIKTVCVCDVASVKWTASIVEPKSIHTLIPRGSKTDKEG